MILRVSFSENDSMILQKQKPEQQFSFRAVGRAVSRCLGSVVLREEG